MAKSAKNEYLEFSIARDIREFSCGAPGADEPAKTRVRMRDGKNSDWVVRVVYSCSLMIVTQHPGRIPLLLIASLAASPALFACGGKGSRSSSDPSNAPDGGTGMPGDRTSKCPPALAPELRAEADCWTLEVPQNRVRDTLVTLKLPVIVFHATPASSKAPVVYLAGGPGASVLDDVTSGPAWARLFGRDVIFFEQRGTDAATPTLVCNAPESDADCLARWKSEGIDQASFNTIENAEDLAALSTALHSPIVAWGNSYSTRLVQRLVQRRPEAVEALIMSGTLPSSGSPITLSKMKANDAVLVRLSNWIKKKFRAQNLSPTDINPATDFPAAMQIAVADPASNGLGGKSPFAFYNLLTVIRENLSFQPYIALWAYQTAHGISPSAPRQAWMKTTLSKFSGGESGRSTFASAMYYATMCFDEYQFWEPWHIPHATSGLGLPASVEAEATAYYEHLYRRCQELLATPSGYPPEAFRIAGSSPSVPTLFLIGDLDTSTPAEWATSVIPNFPRRQEVHGECQGHWFFGSDAVYSIIASFVQDPNRPVDITPITNACIAPIEQPSF